MLSATIHNNTHIRRHVVVIDAEKTYDEEERVVRVGKLYSHIHIAG